MDEQTGRVWIRTPAPRIRSGARTFLAVGDGEGFVLGVAPLLWDPEEERSLEIELERTCALSLELDYEDPKDERFYRNRSKITLSPESAKLLDPSFAWRAARRRGLKPGNYELAVSTRIHAKQTQSVELVAGETTALPMFLALEDGLRDVHIELRSESGNALPNTSLFLQLDGLPDRSWLVTHTTDLLTCSTGIDAVAGTSSSARKDVAHFELAGVPRRELVVRSRQFDEACRATFEERSDGGLDVEVVLLDSPGGSGHAIRAYLPGGEPIDHDAHLHSRVMDEGGPWPTTFEHDARLSHSDPTERKLEWAAVYHGHQASFGDAQEFELQEDGRHLVELHFQPGWRARVVVKDVDGFALRNLPVLVDGQVAGRTDALGVLEVTADAAPARVEVDAPGWRPVPAYPAVPWRASQAPWFEIELHRAPE